MSVKVNERGLSRAMFAQLTAGDSPSYGTTFEIPGAMELSGELKSEHARIAADDDPSYLSYDGYYEGELSLKMTGALEADVAKLTNVVKKANGTTSYGEQSAVKYLGFKYTKELNVDGLTYFKDRMYHRVWCEPPVITGKTKDANNNEIADFTMKIHVEVLIYAESGVKKCRTMSSVNSRDNATAYGTLKDACFTPAQADGATYNNKKILEFDFDADEGMSGYYIQSGDDLYYYPSKRIDREHMYCDELNLGNLAIASLVPELVEERTLTVDVTTNGVTTRSTVSSGGDLALPLTGNVIVTLVSID